MTMTSESTEQEHEDTVVDELWANYKARLPSLVDIAVSALVYLIIVAGALFVFAPWVVFFAVNGEPFPQNDGPAIAFLLFFLVWGYLSIEALAAVNEVLFE